MMICIRDRKEMAKGVHEAIPEECDFFPCFFPPF